MPQREITVTINVCSRCGFEWQQRFKDSALPARCAKCRSQYWNVARTRGVPKPEPPPTKKAKKRSRKRVKAT